jgi:hypothetical protein
MSEIQANTRVLEDGDEALIKGSVERVESEEEQVEYVDLTKLEEKPAAKKADEKPAAAAPVEKKPAAPSADDELPADLKGKTPAQIAKMLKDAQSLIGRQGNELGDLRSRVDVAIQASLAALNERKQATPAPAKPAEEPLDESKFFAQPIEAVNKLLENHPLIKEIRDKLGKQAADTAQSRAADATARFNAAHPDAPEILQDAEFRKWVSASKTRQRLLHEAHTQFNFESGDEVFSTWKALKDIKRSAPVADAGTTAAAAAPADDVSAAARTLAAARAAKTAAATQAAAAQAAAVPSGGASAGKNTGGKKVFRRADVLHLMENDPDRYEALADEITLAYKEGRVR